MKMKRKARDISLEKKNEPTKKLNKRILKKRAKLRSGKIALAVFLITITSPLWLYIGIIREVILPSVGITSKGVLTEIRGPWGWSSRRYYIPDYYYYTFEKNSKRFEGNSNITTKDTSFHLGDTVDVIYLKRFPFINALKLPKEKKE